MSLRKTDLDLYSVLEASRVIQGEIELEPLLSKLMHVMVQNAGAQWGVIALKRKTGLVIEARTAEGGGVVLETAPVEGNRVGVPASVVRYVARTRENVVLEDASLYGPFVRDPAIVERRPLSVLCLPIVHQTELVGIFYLENNLARNAFTEDHLDVLKLLASQAATSIENAKLYADLEESEKKYRALMEAMPDGVMVHTEGIIRFVNRKCLELLGAEDLEDVLGREAMSLVHPDYHEQASQRIATVYDRAGLLKPIEYKLIRLDGGIIDVDMAASSVEYQGLPAGQVVIRDITEKKLTERQLFRAEKMASLGQIIAGVAHEINNPNNFVHFNLPILRHYIGEIKPYLDQYAEQDSELMLCNMPYAEFMEDIDKLIDNMSHGSTRITEIVSELKDYVGSSSQGDSLKVGKISTVVDSVMMLVGKQVRKMVKRFEVEIEPGLPPVTMNAGKIEQVLINLVINAGQASDKDDSFVRLVAASGSPGTVVLTVEDNGTGIPEEICKKIFDPFFTTKGRETGTGLGLAITQRIIEDHDGTISVESTPGEGTLFAIVLPANG